MNFGKNAAVREIFFFLQAKPTVELNIGFVIDAQCNYPRDFFSISSFHSCFTFFSSISFHRWSSRRQHDFDFFFLHFLILQCWLSIRWRSTGSFFCISEKHHHQEKNIVMKKTRRVSGFFFIISIQAIFPPFDATFIVRI
jgi:hypothetical protein